MNPLLKALGKNIRERRTTLGMSQEQLAAKCGLHRTYVGGVERGERNISVLNLSRLAGVLRVETSELLMLSKADYREKDFDE
jgi:transcriptional regulator with XRE-family HTH domain